jgi:DNA-binding HxlR family transcriptional regulator
MLATALEHVGDRWTLLVVRDLVGGPRRFTDLSERLGGITPKTLSQRLRSLEADGLVEVDREPGRREVWYRLTDAGRDLVPALDELMLWGLRHDARPPEPGEPAHPEHLLWALKVQLEREGVHPGAVHWVVRFADDGSYVIRHDDGVWAVTPGDADDAEVVVTTTRDAWARFLTAPPSARSAGQADVQLAGTRRAVRTFMNSIAVFPFRERGARS